MSPSYPRVFFTFARNSLVRDMTFRLNFIIDCISSLSWVVMNLGFYVLIFVHIGSSAELAEGSGWRQYEFFVFLSTTLLVNSLVQAFFMPNADEFSELIRTGGLDFALLKPIDTQFLVSLRKVEWSSLANFAFGAGLLAYSLWKLDYRPGPVECVLYPLYVLCGVAILYSLMIALAATSIWLGRNESLYDFWFYITNFSRYPMEIYRGRWGTPLRLTFTFAVPILVVVNVPARLLAKPLLAEHWYLSLFALVATALCLVVSRWLFSRALLHYRSASS
ncbi:MAG: ABC-2 family transporter protein [Planctomycetia bacterium]|nr:ABC-2 family transporter protein [Planctomycetia bacterium]